MRCKFQGVREHELLEDYSQEYGFLLIQDLLQRYWPKLRNVETMFWDSQKTHGRRVEEVGPQILLARPSTHFSCLPAKDKPAGRK